MALDSLISNWTPASISMMKRRTRPAAGGNVALDLGRSRVLPAMNASTRNPVLQVGMLDAGVAGDFGIRSLFTGKGRGYPSLKAKPPGRLTGS